MLLFVSYKIHEGFSDVESLIDVVPLRQENYFASAFHLVLSGFLLTDWRKKMILQQPAERHAFTHHFRKPNNWKINNAQNNEKIVSQLQLSVQDVLQN